MEKVLLRGVDPAVKQRAEKVRTWMESSDGQTAVSEIAKRAKTAEDRMREAQSIDAQPVYQIALWT